MSNMTRQNGTREGGLKTFLDTPAVRAKLAEVASAAMKPDDLIRLALMAASRQPELLKCTQHSVLRSLMDAAALGIKPGGLMGRGYLVPRMNRHTRELECCFDPGWRGLVDIARRTGKIKRIEAHVVFDNDQFRVTRSPLTTVFHEPSEDDPGPIRAAYAVAEFTDGAIQIEVLWKRDLEKIRNTSASKNGPWATWPDEMSRKSAVRRLCKYLPYDPLLERAIEAATDADQEEPMGRAIEMVPAPPARTGLADKIRANRAKGERESGPKLADEGEADAGATAVVDDPYAPREESEDQEP